MRLARTRSASRHVAAVASALALTVVTAGAGWADPAPGAEPADTERGEPSDAPADINTLTELLGPDERVADQGGDLLNLVQSASRARAFATEDEENSIASPFGTYSWTGEYLDYANRSSIASGSNTKLDDRGVIMVARGDGYIYNPVTISQYGLQEWSYYRRTGNPVHLNKALRQAGWLVSNQDIESGTWQYDYAFTVGGFDETLQPGWTSAMAQGQAMSLLTRIAQHFPDKPAYLHTARRAYRPLVKTVENGGHVAYLEGRPYYEEYPTHSAPSLALNGFQFTLIGLHDLMRTGFGTAKQLFVQGYETMSFALELHDAKDTSAYHLGHITKPPRPIHHADHYHRIHVQLLRTLYTIRKDVNVRTYAIRWSTYPPCEGSSQCGF